MINTIKIDPLEADEFDFIQRKYEKESKAFLYGMNLLLIGTVSIPCIVGLVYYIKFKQTDLMLKAFLYALIITVVLFSIVCFLSYMKNLYEIKKDISQKTKTVESVIITEKKYMAMNNTYHFYITSKYKYTIEVSEEDFPRFSVGDEVNIEYATHSKEYFGYY